MEYQYTSSLVVDYHRRYVSVSQEWAVAFLASLAAPDTVLFSIRLLLEESLLFVVDKYEDRVGQAELCLRLAVTSAGRMQCEIDDRGPPIAAELLPDAQRPIEDPLRDLWLKVVRGHAPDIEFVNRGSDGWRIRFSLHAEDWHPPVPDAVSPPSRVSRDVSAELATRAVRPGDAPAIARLVYATYRYSYQHPDIYDPHKYAQKLLAGDYEVSAVTHEERLVGIAAIKSQGMFEYGVEAGALMVDPAYRGTGVRERLDVFFDTYYATNPHNKHFIFAYQVTQHDKSQKNHGPDDPYYFRPLSFFLNKNPPIRFVGMNEQEAHREAAIEVFMPLVPLRISRVVLPTPAHRDIVMDLLTQLGISPSIDLPTGQLETQVTRAVAKTHKPGRYAVLEISRLGQDWQTSLAAQLIDLFGQGFAAVRVLVPAVQDLPPDLHGVLTSLGAGFCGMALIADDQLAYSYVRTNEAVAFDGIRVFHPAAQRLLSFIQSQWPVPSLH